ncbi:GrpB family protein [Haloplasma contractile]|uniref:GrpB family protein n=1 Tax=Haloplasma contractile SSD-17B TaxID=1033810 RepID=U2FLR2_9MOLU|nr:GrpB family protein [Haloplasma contractile]ERJ12129.1 hypothetical protein HLPCO_001656 [Haloplasma contractile SSD-17B]
MQIVVEDYNPEWEKQFNELKSVYKTKLKHIDIQIEHVGSTSVPGLAAKPIIDIDIIVENQDDVRKVINCLQVLGYEHQGDLGINGREAFKRKSEAVPYVQEYDAWCRHHLYVCIRGIPSLENHLRLRNYLRDNENAVREYGKLKKSLAVKYPNDIDSYIEGKTSFITNILTKVGMSRHVSDITEQNKK